MSAPRDRMPRRSGWPSIWCWARSGFQLRVAGIGISFFESRGQFGMKPHLEPAVLLVHGIVAILSMYLLGWVTARHVLRWWPGRLRA